MSRAYVKWFVGQQSGDAKLAARLARQWQEGWTLMLRRFREGKSSAAVAQELKSCGYNAILLEQGFNSLTLPGKTVTFLVLNRENSCRQINFERWIALVPKTTNIILIGMGEKDTRQKPIPEKQIHICACELPKAGDYLQMTTQSFSPLGKVVIGFVALGMLAGCTNDKPSAPSAPVAPSPPAVPKDPTGKPGPHQVTTDDGSKPFPNGKKILLPTNVTNGKSSLEEFDRPAIKSNIAPGVPRERWYWFWIFTTNSAKFSSGCKFYLEVKRRVKLNGADYESAWHVDTPKGANVWVDGEGLHFLDTPGYAPNVNNPAPYNDDPSKLPRIGPNEHLIVTWFWRLWIWCPSEPDLVYEYDYSKTLEIDQDTLKNGTSLEKPKFVGTRSVTGDDQKNLIAPQ